MFQFILFAIIASAAANSCPDFTTVDNFDFKAYGQGTWYELAKYPNVAEGDMAKCGYAVYTPQGDTFKINNFDYVDGKLREISGTGRLAPDAGTNGRMIFNYPYGPNGSLADNPVNILYTDNKSIAVVYYCRFDEKKQTKTEFSWVLSRSKNLSSSTKAGLESFLKASDVLESSKYRWNDFADEACKEV